MRVHVKPVLSDALCARCRRGSTTQFDDGRQWHYCHMYERPLPKPVRECSSFDDKSQDTIYEMKQVAWLLDGGKGKRMGFRGTARHGPYA